MYFERKGRGNYLIYKLRNEGSRELTLAELKRDHNIGSTCVIIDCRDIETNDENIALVVPMTTEWLTYYLDDNVEFIIVCGKGWGTHWTCGIEAADSIHTCCASVDDDLAVWDRTF